MAAKSPPRIVTVPTVDAWRSAARCEASAAFKLKAHLILSSRVLPDAVCLTPTATNSSTFHTTFITVLKVRQLFRRALIIVIYTSSTALSSFGDAVGGEGLPSVGVW